LESLPMLVIIRTDMRFIFRMSGIRFVAEIAGEGAQR
jgi:hypothetical protein